MKIFVKFFVLTILSSVVLSCQVNRKISRSGSPAEPQSPSIKSNNAMLDTSYSPSEAFLSNYGAYMDTVRKYRATRLTFSKRDLYLKKPEGRLNNLLADMLRWYVSRIRGARVDIGFIPYDVMQDTLSKGPIRIGDIYRIIPQDRSMALYEVNGFFIQRLVNFISLRGGGAISGLRLRIEQEKAQSVLVGSEPLEKESWYRLAAPARFFGIEESGRLKRIGNSKNEWKALNRKGKWETNSAGRALLRKQIPIRRELRDIIIAYMNNKETIHRHLDNRIR